MSTFQATDIFWFFLGGVLVILCELFFYFRHKRKVNKFLKENNYHKSTDTESCCSFCIFNKEVYYGAYKHEDMVHCMASKGKVKPDYICGMYSYRCDPHLDIWNRTRSHF